MVLFLIIIVHPFEEEDAGRTPCNEHLAVNEEHLTKHSFFHYFLNEVVVLQEAYFLIHGLIRLIEITLIKVLLMILIVYALI